MDWNHLQTLVAVAEGGSLSEAARRLGLSQPTLGRHVAALEEALGGGVFARHPRGLALTDRGRALYELARSVADGVDAFARRAEAGDDAVAGTVRISAAEVVAHYVLPRVLGSIRRALPSVALEVVADNRVANLLRRDADIAIRMFRPTQRDLVARHVANAALGLFASADYLAHHGTPQAAEAADLGALMRRHTFVGMDRLDTALRAARDAGVELERDAFLVRSDAQAFHVEAAVAGLGVAAVQRAVAARLGLREVLAEAIPLPALPVWLVAHADLRRSARVRSVWEGLRRGLVGFYGGEETSADPR